MTLNTKLEFLEEDERFKSYIKDKFKNKNVKISDGYENIIAGSNVKLIRPVVYYVDSIEILYYGKDVGTYKNFYIPFINREFTLKEIINYLEEKLNNDKL